MEWNVVDVVVEICPSIQGILSIALKDYRRDLKGLNEIGGVEIQYYLINFLDFLRTIAAC